MIAFIDFETTGLIQPSALGEKVQPHIIEACVIVKTADLMDTTDMYNVLVKPPVAIPKKITKITRIDDSMVKGALTFAEHVEPLAAVLEGVDTIVAHNAPYDLGVLDWELMRLGVEDFPAPQNVICTVEKSLPIKRHRLKLVDLYEIATGKRYDDKAHRALDDVNALIECYAFLCREGYIK